MDSCNDQTNESITAYLHFFPHDALKINIRTIILNNLNLIVQCRCRRRTLCIKHEKKEEIRNKIQTHILIEIHLWKLVHPN
jgi:hypothetical protein